MNIQVMKQALDVIKSECGFGGTNTYDPWAIVESLEQAIAEAEKQEPVAWMRKGEDCTDCITWFRTEDNTVPLYEGEAPKREPLTNEQIDAIPWAKEGGVMLLEALRDFARAIEAAHGIKGDAP